MNDKIYPSMVIRSQAEAIELLEKENKELQQENQQLKKQKDDVVEYIKKNTFHCKNQYEQEQYDEYLLRLLGEIDD